MLPATDDRLRTRLRTDEGWLDFQDYFFVRLQCRPVVRELAFDGAERCAALILTFWRLWATNGCAQ